MVSDFKYECYFDHEDLTQAVLAALAEDDVTTVVENVGSDEGDGPKRVVVICSQGHQNTFEV